MGGNVARWRAVFLDKQEIAADVRLRKGWPRALPLMLVALLPSLVAGPVRAVTGLDLHLALILAIAITVAAVWPFRRALIGRQDDTLRSVIVNLVPIVLGAASLYLLYNRDFAGLYGYQDEGGNVAIDAAVHNLTARSFQTVDPGEYQGFVSLYSFWFFMGQFVDFISAANASFHLAELAVAFSPAIVGFSLLQPYKGRPFYAGAVALLVAGGAIGYLLVLPLEAFHFAGGFWAHLFALIPLLGIWWADSLIRSPSLRILAILLLAALYRYTYGLNLADLLAALAGVFALEAAGTRLTRNGRIAAGLVALASLGAAQHAFSLLVPQLTSSTGWIVPHDMATVWRGQLIGVGALGAGMVLERRPLLRALRFPALFALANALSVELFKAQPGGERAYTAMWANYYFNKYSLHAVILLGCALVVAASYWAAALVAKPVWRNVAGTALTAVLLFAGAGKLQEGVAPYQKVLAEVNSHAPYPRLRPWIDVEALRLIRSTLRSEGREHGGYLASYYPLAAFLNGTLGHGKAPFWERQPVETTPGHCVFMALENGNREQFQSCSSYTALWEGGERTLCWKCF
jgi:hypothetical protein